MSVLVVQGKALKASPPSDHRSDQERDIEAVAAARKACETALNDALERLIDEDATTKEKAVVVVGDPGWENGADEAGNRTTVAIVQGHIEY